jgi:hypothetical protein
MRDPRERLQRFQQRIAPTLDCQGSLGRSGKLAFVTRNLRIDSCTILYFEPCSKHPSTVYLRSQTFMADYGELRNLNFVSLHTLDSLRRSHY